MKTFYTTILTLLFSQLALTQTNVYQPYPSDNASWTMRTQLYNGQTYTEDWNTTTWSGDTIINGQTYTKVLDLPNIVGVRQEVSNEKIFYIDDVGIEYDASFDQSAMPGDTIIVTPAFVMLNSNSSAYMMVNDTTTVTSIDSVFINSIYHKTIRFSTNGFELIDATYICGVGLRSATTSISSAFNIECYYVNGYQYLGNPLNPYCTANTDELSESTINIYPNPSDGQFYIDYDLYFDLQEVIVLDITGKQVKRFEVENGQEGYDISSLPNGTYLVEMKFDQGYHRTTLIR